MAKTLVVNKFENTRVPFLRGILIRSLQDAGVGFDDAYELASKVRDDINESAEITSDELRDIVTADLEKHHHPDIVQRYQSPPVVLETIFVRDGKQQAPFSRGQHRQSVESSGFSSTEAALVTAKVYESLLTHGIRELSNTQLAHLTYQYLEDDYGAESAHRYVVWNEFMQSGRPMLLLIGGTIGCGKSTIAAEISHRLEIVRTQSTDMLREVMRMMMPETLLPVLHTSSFKAWQVLPFVDDETPRDLLITEGYQSQAELLAGPCEAVLNRALGERVSMILEGVHVRPTLLERIPKDTDAIVIHAMLAVLKPGKLRRRLKGRGAHAAQRRAERYLKHFEEIWQLQSFLLSEADQHEIPIIPNDQKKKNASQQLMGIIGQELSRHFPGKLAKVFGEADDITGRIVG